MDITGSSIVAGSNAGSSGATITATDPTTGCTLPPDIHMISEEGLQQALDAAQAAAVPFRTAPLDHRGALLDRIATNLGKAGDAVVDRAALETGLTRGRLASELDRTIHQLRMFGRIARSGEFLDARVDPALPDRLPAPRSDIRQQRVALGPVAVFGASNFPLAFSTAGGDTASALAAGCPVVVKAHNAHPGTSELVARCVTAAVESLGMPAGVFSLVFGEGATIGQRLAAAPEITAIGFTGSRGAGLALCRTAAERPTPIPVYAEMSSSNPVFVLPGALGQDDDGLARGYLTAVTGSSGQLCTSPGLLFVPEGTAGDSLVSAVRDLFGEADGQTMLTAAIAEAWRDGVDLLGAQPGVELLARGRAGATGNAPPPSVFLTDTESFLASEAMQQEVFGAASVVVRYRPERDLARVISRLEGQLTVTLHLGADDDGLAAAVFPALERLAGRIIVNGWPTGVEVGHAMVHGGPFPATSDPRGTSVGSAAVERFLRPVAYQDVPDRLLPPALQRDNPLGLERRVDGRRSAGRF